MRASFRSCYRRALERDDSAPLTQKFDLMLLVNANGTVESATVEGEQEPSLSYFFYCLKARATASEFVPAPGKPSRLRFSIDATGKRPN